MAELKERSRKKKKEWLSNVKSVFESGPFASDGIYGLLLVGLEKFVELEFICPCDPAWNKYYVTAFFVIPGVLAFLLMMTVKDWKRNGSGETAKKYIMNLGACMVPVIIWLILLFFDGQYYACAQTVWSGSYVYSEKDSHMKWCEPVNSTSSKELLIKSQKWFFHSQVIGVTLAVVGALGVFISKFL